MHTAIHETKAARAPRRDSFAEAAQRHAPPSCAHNPDGIRLRACSRVLAADAATATATATHGGVPAQPAVEPALAAHSGHAASMELAAPAELAAAAGHAVPDGRAAATDLSDGLLTSFSAHLLDEIDYGAFTLSPNGRVITMNRAARVALDEQSPLQVASDGLRARPAANARALDAAIAGAARGLRRLLVLQAGAASLIVSVIPLTIHGELRILVMLGKRSLCARLSVVLFAKAYSLTPSELRVLEALYEGLSPQKVAERNEVQLSTVRSQIGAIRSKTGAESISELLRQVSALPPIMAVA